MAENLHGAGFRLARRDQELPDAGDAAAESRRASHPAAQPQRAIWFVPCEVLMQIAECGLLAGLCNGSRGVVKGFGFNGYPIVRFAARNVSSSASTLSRIL